jgi:DNA-binding LacI/PurR family transcriptional regulator
MRLLPVTMTDRRTVAGVMLPDSSYFAHCMNLLYHRAEARGLSIACRIMQPSDIDDFAPPSREEDRPLGFVLFDWVKISPLARRLAAEGNRVVVVGAPPQGITSDIPCVHGDDEQGAYLLTRHLFDLGHTRIATTSFFEWTLRWHGHQRAVREAERADSRVRATRLDYHEFKGWFQDPARALDFLRAPEAPTAIVCWNDDEAAQMVGALVEAGLRVPGDISVVGYDNLPSSQLVYPNITTVDQGIDAQLRAALDLLLRPEPPPLSHSTIVTSSLIVRKSAEPPPLTEAM